MSTSSSRSRRPLLPALLGLVLLLAALPLAASTTAVLPVEVVPAGEVATFHAGDIVRVEGDLVVDGTLVVAPSAGASVFTLDVQGDLIVHGAIDARSGHAALWSDGARAPDGTSVVLRSSTRVVVTETARVLAGDGASGRHALAEGVAWAALAQHGGDGGDVLLLAPEVEVLGTLSPGDGGAGGHALGFLGAHAQGGDGGRAGEAIAHAVDGTTSLGSGDGGDGGHALAYGNSLWQCLQDASAGSPCSPAADPCEEARVAGADCPDVPAMKAPDQGRDLPSPPSIPSGWVRDVVQNVLQNACPQCLVPDDLPKPGCIPCWLPTLPCIGCLVPPFPPLPCIGCDGLPGVPGPTCLVGCNVDLPAPQEMIPCLDCPRLPREWCLPGTWDERVCLITNGEPNLPPMPEVPRQVCLTAGTGQEPICFITNGEPSVPPMPGVPPAPPIPPMPAPIGVPGVSPPRMGESGCGTHTVRGADGTMGWSRNGGAGGGAMALGCTGMDGKDGRDGTSLLGLTCTAGEDGSPGAAGGTAGNAVGGTGGDAFEPGPSTGASPGRGGDAISRGGYGGYGGAGGEPGDSALMSCGGGRGGDGGEGGDGGHAKGGDGGRYWNLLFPPLPINCGGKGYGTSEAGVGGQGGRGGGGAPDGRTAGGGSPGIPEDGEDCRPW